MPDDQNPTFTDSDLPALYRDMDQTSLASQVKYLRLMAADLIVLVIGGLLSAIGGSEPASEQILHVLSAFLLAAGTLLTVAVAKGNYERAWYGGRAAAETIKSISWKYMTKAKPFGPGIRDDEASKEFVSALKEILRSRKELALARQPTADTTDQITGRMKAVRAKPLGERLAVYRSNRLRDQCDWYSRKSTFNRKREGVWFGVSICLQAGAFLAALLQVVRPEVRINFASVFAGAGAAAIAWLQLKRHQEMAQSYALAAHELGLANEAGEAVNTDEDLASFVEGAEGAISREHTMWVARRSD